MTRNASLPTRAAYCITLLGAILPIGLGKSGWVALATGPSLAGSIPMLGPILFLVVGLYRVYGVVRTPGTLDATPATGFIAFLRRAGLLFLYVGAIAVVLGWAAGPLVHSLLRSRTENGVEFFVIGLIVAMLSQIGIIGLVLYEFSRLRGFEQRFSCKGDAFQDGGSPVSYRPRRGPWKVRSGDESR